MLQVNESKSGLSSNTGDAKLLIVLDSDTRAELEHANAKQMALNIASNFGWSHAGIGGDPCINAVDAATGECMTTLVKGMQISGYRGEFVIVKRL